MRRILLPVLMMFVLSSGGSGPAKGADQAYGPDGSPILIILLTCHPDGTVTSVLPGFGDSAGGGSLGFDRKRAICVDDLNPPPSADPLNGYLKLRYSVSVSGATMSGSVEAVKLDLTGAVVQDTSGITVTGAAIAVEQIGAP